MFFENHPKNHPWRLPSAQKLTNPDRDGLTSCFETRKSMEYQCDSIYHSITAISILYKLSTISRSPASVFLLLFAIYTYFSPKNFRRPNGRRFFSTNTYKSLFYHFRAPQAKNFTLSRLFGDFFL